MAILIDENTKVLVQGATGGQGAFHTERMIEYGTNVVAGVTPGKGGKKILDKIPVFDTVLQAVRETGANTSCIFVPPKFATDAIMEAIDAQMKLVVTITEHIPALDMIKVHRVLDAQTKTRLVGPNCPGIISPGKCKVGIMPGYIHKPGHVGVVSRSGTLTYEAVSQLSALGIGQSTCVGIGGDSIVGTDFTDVLTMFNEDEETHQVVLIGEIGGTAEELAAEYIKTDFKKPVVALIAGKTAPPGKRMGHAGALISGGRGTAAAKINALEAVGVNVVDAPSAIGTTLQSVL